MDFNLYLEFMTKNFLFSFSILVLSFVFGWFLYNYVILRKIQLKDALFEKDNLAAWIEFIGAFIFPTLYLASQAVQGAASDNLFMDLLICLAYTGIYMVVFTLLRLLSGVMVKTLCPKDTCGSIELNKEIYIQKNTASALFSVGLSTIFVSLIKVLDISSMDQFVTSLQQMAVILIFTLCAIISYNLLVRRKTSLIKEVFIDNNPAAGVSFAGFIFAVEYLLGSLVVLQTEFDFGDLAVLSLLSMVILGVLSIIIKWLFTKVIRVDIWKEVYEQNNVGAAIGQIALYIGIANVIIHYIK